MPNKPPKIDLRLWSGVILVIASLAVALVPQSPLALAKILAMRKQLAQAYSNTKQSQVAALTQRKQQPQIQAMINSYATAINDLNGRIRELNLTANPHMPSILILLEQNANQFGLNLEIYYDKVSGAGAGQATTTAPAATPAQTPTTAVPGTKPNGTSSTGSTGGTKPASGSGAATGSASTGTGTAANGSTTPAGGSTKTTTTPAPAPAPAATNTATATTADPIALGGLHGASPTSPSDNDQTLRSHIDEIITALPKPANRFVTLTVIPIRVTGKYDAIREYLHFLDQVDYIEPAYIEMHSNGDKVDALVMLYVFALKGGQ